MITEMIVAGALGGAIGGAVMGHIIVALLGSIKEAPKQVWIDFWYEVLFWSAMGAFSGAALGSHIFNFEGVLFDESPEGEVIVEALLAALYLTISGTFLGFLVGAFVKAYKVIENLDKSDMKKLKNRY